jgi:hypothetical protein
MCSSRHSHHMLCWEPYNSEMLFGGWHIVSAQHIMLPILHLAYIWRMPCAGFASCVGGRLTTYPCCAVLCGVGVGGYLVLVAEQLLTHAVLCCAVLSCIMLCRVGVSSEPQHKQLELTPADKVLVLASDGECCCSQRPEGGRCGGLPEQNRGQAHDVRPLLPSTSCGWAQSAPS